MENLALALGIALSPFAVIPAILLLFTEQPRRTSGAFLVGWLLGVAAVTGLGILLADVLDAVGTDAAWPSWARLVLGFVLIVLGLRPLWLKPEAKELPRWMSGLQTADAKRALILGLILTAANPKVAALGFAGGLAIGKQGSSAGYELAGLAAFSVVASISVAAPIIGFLVGGQRVMAPLGRLRAWLERHHVAVMSVVLTVIGALLVVKGYQGL